MWNMLFIIAKICKNYCIHVLISCQYQLSCTNTKTVVGPFHVLHFSNCTNIVTEVGPFNFSNWILLKYGKWQHLLYHPLWNITWLVLCYSNIEQFHVCTFPTWLYWAGCVSLLYMVISLMENDAGARQLTVCTETSIVSSNPDSIFLDSFTHMSVL